MISANKKRIAISMDKELLHRCRRAAAEWGITLSEYLCYLAYVDITNGLTAQARDMVKTRAFDKEWDNAGY